MSRQLIKPAVFIPRGFRNPKQPVLDRKHSLSRGLVAFWPLGDGGLDLLGFNDATVTNGPLTHSGGYAGGEAPTLNGSTQCFVPGRMGNAPTPFSIVCLAKSTGTSRQAYAGAANSGVTQANFYFETDRFGGGSGGGFAEINYTAPTANVWHVIVATCSAANVGTVYIDGVQVASGSISRGGNNAGEFAIGRLGAYTGGQFFGGQLQAMRLYDFALPAETVRQLTTNPWAGVYGVQTAADFALVPFSTETGTGIMSFSGISFAGLGGRKETGTANLAFNGISFNATGTRIHVKGTANMAFGGVTITASGFDPGVPGAGLRQFWTC